VCPIHIMKAYRIFTVRFLIIVSLFSVFFNSYAQENNGTGKVASKPLFRDPVYDGAADPVVVRNQQEKKWFMFYTNRRANAKDLDGVTWVHGTRIGIAESSDGGATWQYRDTCNIPFPYTKTQWAPEVIEGQGTYHMYLSYVPGIFKDWKHPRHIIHLTSKNLIDWKYESTLDLASDKVIDACVIQLPDGNWRMWYNNEKDSKSIYYADSKDLYNWEDKGKAIADHVMVKLGIWRLYSGCCLLRKRYIRWSLVTGKRTDHSAKLWAWYDVPYF